MQLVQAFTAVGEFAHRKCRGLGPFAYPPDGETPRFNRDLESRFSRGAAEIPRGLSGIVYLLAIPFTPSPNPERATEKWDRLTTLIREESLGRTAAISTHRVADRVFMTLGINRYRSIDPEEDRAVLQWSRGLKPETLGFPCRTLTTLWETSFLLRNEDGSTTKVSADIAQPAFLVLEYLVGTKKAQEMKESLSKEHLRKQIPFTHIREWIAQDIFNLRGFKNLTARCVTYLLSTDDDSTAFRFPNSVGLLTAYDEIVRASPQPPQLMSTGYWADRHVSLGTHFAIELDMRIREAVARCMPLAVYFPEPNTAILVSDPRVRKAFTYKNKLSLHTEGQRLLTNLQPVLDLSRVKFVAQPCLATSIPDRMEASKEVTACTLKELGQKGKLIALRGISQTHTDPTVLSDNIWKAIPHDGVNIYIFRGIFAAIFQCLDPIALAQSLPHTKKYSWKFFQFLMEVYPKWIEFFIPDPAIDNIGTSDPIKKCWPFYATKVWAGHAQSIGDRLFPEDQKDISFYEDVFNAHLQRYEGAYIKWTEDLKQKPAALVPIIYAAKAAGEAIYQLFLKKLRAHDPNF